MPFVVGSRVHSEVSKKLTVSKTHGWRMTGGHVSKLIYVYIYIYIYIYIYTLNIYIYIYIYCRALTVTAADPKETFLGAHTSYVSNWVRSGQVRKVLLSPQSGRHGAPQRGEPARKT